MSHVHPVKVRASVRGLAHDDDRITAATLLYDAIVHQRRFTPDDKVSHVAGCVLDVAMAAAHNDIVHLATSIYIVSTFPLDFATYPIAEPGDVGADVARALTRERFGGGTR